MIAPSWLWIPLTLFAAAAQTVRNTVQRRLTDELGTLGATLVRFLYGMPLLTLWLVGILALRDFDSPRLTWSFAGWVVLSALSQTAGTALLLRAMAARSFAIGLVYSKSEVIQVALFSIVFLGERASPLTFAAIALATFGVVLLSPRAKPGMTAQLGRSRRVVRPRLGNGLRHLDCRLSRRQPGARRDSPFLAAAETLFWSHAPDAAARHLAVRAQPGHPPGSAPCVAAFAVRRRRRRLRLARQRHGAGARTGSHVRTLILIEVVFTYAVSLRVFREAISRRELAGIALVILGVGTIVATSG